MATKRKLSPRPVRSPAERQFIASLAHGLEILEALAAAGTEMSLAAMSAQAGRPKPTTWRLLHTLVKLGYVHQNSETRRFSLAPRVLSLGACFEGMDLKELASPFLRDLSVRVGETVNMAVLDDTKLIYIERIKTTQIVNINLHVGSRLPLCSTSMGRALLAFLPAEQLRACMARLQAHEPDARPYLANGGRRLLEILADTRQRGYALNDQELVSGLRSVGCPVWDGTSKAVAAINIAVPSARVSLRDLKSKYAPELVTTAHDISAALGFRSGRRIS
jgi:IclR family pca regulon transcriptional regulator